MSGDIGVNHLIDIFEKKITIDIKKEKIIIIQKNVRRFLNNVRLKKLKDGMTLNIVESYLDMYIKNYYFIEDINKKLCKKKIRNQNFPSEISENIVKFAFLKKYKIIPSWDTDNGDLSFLNKKIEVKGFMSSGPSSFGSTEKWDILYFVDSTKFIDKKFIIYEIMLSNTNPIWRNIKLNKNETYNDQCKKGIRPRITFKELYEQLKNDYCKKIFDGYLSELY